MNLINRPGFQFQTDVTHPETVYVKNLVLRENAVLNTGLQTLYYENLTQETGAQIVDDPLLGFSLAIIRMDVSKGDGWVHMHRGGEGPLSPRRVRPYKGDAVVEHQVGLAIVVGLAPTGARAR